VPVAFGDDFGDDLAVALDIASEIREGRIAAQQLAVMHAHDAAVEGIVAPPHGLGADMISSL